MVKFSLERRLAIALQKEAAFSGDSELQVCRDLMRESIVVLTKLKRELRELKAEAQS